MPCNSSLAFPRPLASSQLRSGNELPPPDAACAVDEVVAEVLLRVRQAVAVVVKVARSAILHSDGCQGAGGPGAGGGQQERALRGGATGGVEGQSKVQRAHGISIKEGLLPP